MGIILNRRRVCGKSLPYDYEVEWIGTNGDVCFITDFVPNTYDLTCTGKFYLGGYTNNDSWIAWWTAHTNDAAADYRIIRYSNSVDAWVGFGTKGTGGGTSFRASIGGTYTFTFTPTRYIWNGTSQTHGIYNVPNTGALLIFDYRFKGKMIGHFAWNKGNTLIHEYVPVVKNGVGCIYDAVTNKLFYNANTLSGTPIVGPRV